MKDLIFLIEKILDRLDNGGNWNIFRDEILETLNLDITAVYRLMVTSKNPLVKFSTATYLQKDTGALICLLR